MIHYKKGNLLEATEHIIAHGCNCRGGFGSGVAGQIAMKWPEARSAYFRQYDSYGWELGFVQLVDIGDKIIANCATQLNYLPRRMCHADYGAIHDAMAYIRDYAKPKNLKIAIPKIGAGLAGGDWEVIETILRQVFESYDVTVYDL